MLEHTKKQKSMFEKKGIMVKQNPKYLEVSYV